MPNSRFSSASRAQLEELENLGSPVDLSVAGVTPRSQDLQIEQTGSVDFASNILELQGGGVGYVAEISITNLLTRPVKLIRVELRAPWIDRPVHWLTAIPIRNRASAHRSSTSLVYRFPENDMTFDYDEVLNHRLLEEGILPGKCSFQGLLLAAGGPLPAELRHGEWRDLCLTVVAADHTEYSTTLQLWTTRLPEELQKPPSYSPERIFKPGELQRNDSTIAPQSADQAIASSAKPDTSAQENDPETKVAPGE